MNKLSIAVLISGRGSNLLAIIDAIKKNRLAARISVVISDRIDAPGCQIAQQGGIDTAVLKGDDKIEVEQNLQLKLDEKKPDLIVLAGYMRILSHEFVNARSGRIVNIHPSLLPEFPGLNTHRRVLAAGIKEHGASVHFVSAEVDAGPLIVQAKVPVLEHDTESILAKRVLEQEHIIYPMALQWFAEKRIHLKNNQAFLDDFPLPKVFSH